MKLLLEKTSKAEQEIANASLQNLIESINQITAQQKKVAQLKVADSDKVVTIPLKALTLLKFIMNNMAEGNTVGIMTTSTEITTQEAADILNVSRPYVVKLLKNGKIPFHKVGTHRRMSLKDVLIYSEQMKQQQLEAMKLLAKQAQELNMGYE